MGRPRTVLGTAPGSVGNYHSIYIGPQDWEDLGKIAAQQNKAISVIIRDLVAPLLCQFRGGDMFVPTFDLEVKEKELKTYKIKVDNYYDSLKKEILGNRKSVFDTMVAEAIMLGSDNSLTKNIEEVLDKLKLYNCTGKEPFTDSHVVIFALFLDALLNQRRVKEEIKSYWCQIKERPQEKPLAPIIS